MERRGASSTSRSTRRCRRAGGSARWRAAARPAPRRSRSRRSRRTRCGSRACPTASCCRDRRDRARPGGLGGVHPENDDIVRRLIAAERAAGGRDPLAHAAPRPPVAETRGDRALPRARHARPACRTHLCHVSVERGFALVGARPRDGVDATAETCTHYLADGRGRPAPARRRRQDQPAAAPARAAGCALAPARRRWTRSSPPTTSAGRASSRTATDIFAARSGVPGLETTLPLLQRGRRKRGLPLSRWCTCSARGRRARYGLWPAQGRAARSAPTPTS